LVGLIDIKRGMNQPNRVVVQTEGDPEPVDVMQRGLPESRLDVDLQ